MCAHVPQMLRCHDCMLFLFRFESNCSPLTPSSTSPSVALVAMIRAFFPHVESARLASRRAQAYWDDQTKLRPSQRCGSGRRRWDWIRRRKDATGSPAMSRKEGAFAFPFPQNQISNFRSRLDDRSEKKERASARRVRLYADDEAGPRRRQETSAPSSRNCYGEACMITSIFLILSFTDIHSSCSI